MACGPNACITASDQRLHSNVAVQPDQCARAQRLRIFTQSSSSGFDIIVCLWPFKRSISLFAATCVILDAMELLVSLLALFLFLAVTHSGTAYSILDQSGEETRPCSENCSVWICQNLWRQLIEMVLRIQANLEAGTGLNHAFSSN